MSHCDDDMMRWFDSLFFWRPTKKRGKKRNWFKLTAMDWWRRGEGTETDALPCSNRGQAKAPASHNVSLSTSSSSSSTERASARLLKRRKGRTEKRNEIITKFIRIPSATGSIIFPSCYVYARITQSPHLHLLLLLLFSFSSAEFAHHTRDRTEPDNNSCAPERLRPLPTSVSSSSSPNPIPFVYSRKLS